MPAACSLLLEVYEPVSLDGYDDEYSDELVAWEVSSDRLHAYPFLIAPRQYAEQEIDAVRCTASIGTIEVGVIDKAEVPGDQTTGFMTARVHDLLGRRCRLRRWINNTIGYVTIADGPAGSPRLDSTYSAYRWTIRDTRDTERKMALFNAGGVAGVAPRGPMYGFGQVTDEYETTLLLERVIDIPIVGNYDIQDLSLPGGVTKKMGIVNLAAHFSGTMVDSESLMTSDAGVTACEISELLPNIWGARFADVLWRVVGDTVWNIARMTTPSTFLQPMAGFVDASLTGGGDLVPCLNFVTLFVDDDIPTGFPTDDVATDIEVIVRYRGPATEDFPYYVEGELGEVLINLYNGKYSLMATDEIEGLIYDPAGLDVLSDSFLSRIQFDADAFAQMQELVTLRQTEPIEDGRDWTESTLYSPSGWIPALDNDMRISPVSRAQPSFIDDGLQVNDNNCIPAANWNQGQRTVSEITYTYPRWYVPIDPFIEVTEYDGLAKRDITVTFQDPESELRYGKQAETYDASAFAAIGDEDGLNIAGVSEQASLLAQAANFDVLERFRSGVQSIAVQVRREYIVSARVGAWLPWDLSWFPDRVSGLRGSTTGAAMIVSLRDDDCVLRTIVIEESGGTGSIAGSPGYASSLTLVSDEAGAGESSGLIVISDVES